MTDSTHVIEVRDLYKRYGARGPEALKGVSFFVTPGELFGLLGPNGAGKTTTIGVLTTRVWPPPGRISLSTVPTSGSSVVTDGVGPTSSWSNSDSRTAPPRGSTTIRAGWPND
ncbi:hypothetical protein BH23ACT6_BH23ACT6_16590 [soil metagenome]